MNNCTIDIARESILPGENDGTLPVNIVSEALVKFLDVLKFNVGEQKEDIPLFRSGKEGRRLLVIPSNCTNRLKDYFKQLALWAYNIDRIDLDGHGFLFVDLELSNTNKDWRSGRFFHVMGSIFKYSEIGWKVEVDKLPDLIKYIESESELKIKTNELRNCIEETCFATGVEEMREFLLRDPMPFHNIFKELGVDDSQETQEKERETLRIKQSVIRLIFGAYLAGDIDCETLEKALGQISNKHDKSMGSLNDEVNELNRLVHSRFKNPLWKYLENRKILVIDDGWEVEGWNVALSAILLSPGGSFNQCVSRQLFICENVSKALHDHETKKFNLKDIDLILLDLYSSVDEHKRSIHITNMKDPLWQFIEILSDIRKHHIEKNIPQPMPQVIVFSRDDKGLTVHTMFKELNAADYFFKKTEFEEHKCGYYSSFRNAVISALKETVHQVGGMTDIYSWLHFNKWLRQFDPCDRPVILNLMKHFKYFSAVNIMKLLDSYLKNNTKWEDGPEGKNSIVSILKSSPRKPDQFYISYLGHANKSGPATLPLLSKTEWIQKIKEKIEKPNAKKLPGFISYEVLRRKIKGCIKRGTLTNNRVCLIFVDDVVGSGGQLEDYIKKFIGYLKKNIAEEKWVQLEGLEIIAIFALGVHNKVFESILKISERNKESCFLYGTLKKNEELSTPIKVHVAHYTRSIQEIFNANNKFLKEVEETLRKYAVIMELRDEDYPCDFEPLGWKENGGLITTYANAQGNTIPVIWRDYKWDSDSGIQEDDFYIKEWFALYPRYFNPLTPGKKLDKNEKKDIVANDIKVLKCKEMKKCPVNPEKWTKRYFEDYWKNKKNEHPPCKFKHGK